jgi:putative SOS response-associated peptidase YedK
MCGRYYREGDKQKIAEAFHAKLVDDGTPSPPWDYNVASTTIQPIIRNSRDTNERELVSIHWGLIPFFAKSLKDAKGIGEQSHPDLLEPPTRQNPGRRCAVPRADPDRVSTTEGRKAQRPFPFSV